MSPLDDRYQRDNAIRHVSGYYLPRPHEEALGMQGEAFRRAKAECLSALRVQISAIESLTKVDFFAERKRGG